MTTIKHRWSALVRAWEIFDGALRPWEQQGPLRWVKPARSDWELHGSTLPPPSGDGEPWGSSLRS